LNSSISEIKHFFDFNQESLRNFCVENSIAEFTAAQIIDWVYKKHIRNPDEMTNISKRDRTLLKEKILFTRSRIDAHQCSTDKTEKVLLGWFEKSEIENKALNLSLILPQTECVMIPTDERATACVSSQIGCPVGCKFCASGIGGLEGNLSAGQIVEQVYRLNSICSIDRITNVVFMGMGEPLANYKAVTDAIRTINASWGMGIGARKITVSTVGLPGAIRKLVDFEIPVTLALSLHAPNDELRRELIPWSKYTSIDELLDACNEYFQITGREITLEYILLGGVNDKLEHAEELAVCTKKLRCNVNLIRYNEVSSLPYLRPNSKDVNNFQSMLKKQGVNAHIRASRGGDIAAACGQLRHEKMQQTDTS